MFQQQFVDTLSATADSLTPVMQEQAAQMVQELSVWDLTMRGGFIMIPLAILSIISIYIFVERCIAISRARKEDSSFMQRIRDYIHDGEIESARNLCHRTDTPYSRLILKGISRIGRPMNDVLVAIENTGNIEIANLEKGLSSCIGLDECQHRSACRLHLCRSGDNGGRSYRRHYRPLCLQLSRGTYQ